MLKCIADLESEISVFLFGLSDENVTALFSVSSCTWGLMNGALLTALFIGILSDLLPLLADDRVLLVRFLESWRSEISWEWNN